MLLVLTCQSVSREVSHFANCYKQTNGGKRDVASEWHLLPALNTKDAPTTKKSWDAGGHPRSWAHTGSDMELILCKRS